jgi:Ras-related protein Rab-18
MEDIRLYAQRNVEILLVGNKVDLSVKGSGSDRERVIDSKEAQAYAEKHHFDYMETSAKTKVNVEKAFSQLTLRVFDSRMENHQRNNSNNDNKVNVDTANNNDNNQTGWCQCA